ncbi:uncharacterized protein SCHCODRAFT_02673821 [Schizophyllum commune H4-8]|nr:uncharacterized protein SCHCODRAFT_02673821 [Schizophyllum commune H4-8]KAI5884795.1 hypothetical protein SCHCODRAFT_02673821 [Schizophyllum commune H4-8]
MPLPVIEKIAAWARTRCGICIVLDLLTGMGDNPRPADHEPIRCPTLSDEGPRHYAAFRRAIQEDWRFGACNTCHVVGAVHPPPRALRDPYWHPFIHSGAAVPYAIYMSDSLRALARDFVQQSHGVTLPSWDTAELFARWLGSDPNVLTPTHRIAYSNSMILIYFIWWLSTV